VILEITGPAFLRSSEGAPSLQLDPKRDVMRKLFVGQAVRVGPGGRLKLGLSIGIKEVRPSEPWYVLTAPATLTDEQARIAAALRRYGTVGGTRGLGSWLYSPADDSSVWPSHMVIRWNPPVKPGQIGLRLETEGGQRLWTQDGMDAAAQKLDSSAARKALADFQAAGSQESLMLIMKDSEGQESRVTFFLLSRASVQELEKELARWDQVADPMLRTLGRVSEFTRRRLFVEVADAYEAALALAPESQALLASTIDAQRRIGNHARVGELRKRLG